MEQYRHGDIFFRRFEGDLPENMEVLNTRVVAEGELTGHAHRMVGGSVTAYMPPEGALATMFLAIEEMVTLQHEEHAEIQLPAGNWEAIRQREYTPSGDRQVAD